MKDLKKRKTSFTVSVSWLPTILRRVAEEQSVPEVKRFWLPFSWVPGERLEKTAANVC